MLHYMHRLLPLITLCFLITPTVEAQTTDQYWNMAGANPQRTSWVSQDFSVSNHGIIWSLPIEAYIDQKTQIVSAENDTTDTIYVATTRGLYAIKASNGDLRWRYDMALPVGHTPTVINNVIYFGAYDKKVRAIRDNYPQNSYTELWTYTGDSGFSTNPIVENGRVFIASRGGYFYALDAVNGTKIWQYPAAGQSSLGTIAYSAALDNSVLYFATNDMYAYALSTNGQLVWKSPNPLPGERFESWWPVVFGDLVIFSGSVNYRYGGNPGLATFGAGEYTNGDGTAPGVERVDLFGTNDSGLLGTTSTSATGWTTGTNFLDSRINPTGPLSLTDYVQQKPYRRTLVALLKSNGQEGPLIPHGFQGTKSGNRYPPMVNPNDNSLVFINPYQSSGWIPRAKLMAWKPNNPHLLLIGAATIPVDETISYTGTGSRIFSNLCCDRQITETYSNFSFWTYTTNALENITPGYRMMWEPYDGGGEVHLKYTYSGLAQEYGYNRANGIYNSHGNPSAVIPYANKLFTHRSNAIIAIGSGGTRSSSTPLPAKSPLRLPTSPATNSTPLPLTSDMRNRLNQEIQKILSVYAPGQTNRFLKPGYYNLGQGSNQQQYATVGGSGREGDFFSNPGDSLWVLSMAYRQLSDTTLKSQLKNYLTDFIRPTCIQTQSHG
jgi:hypothetical protein